MQRWSSPHFEWIGLSQLRARRKPVDTTTSSHNPLVRRCESKRAQSFHHSGAVTRKARLVNDERELQLALARGRRLN